MQRYFEGEVIARNIILTSSRTSWPLRNIHLSGNNWSFPFYVDIFFLLWPTTLLPDLTMSKLVTVWKETRTTYPSRTPQLKSHFWWIRVAHLFSFCFVFFVLFAFVLCIIHNVTCVSVLYIRDWPFGFL
jgi:hypothetical protein